MKELVRSGILAVGLAVGALPGLARAGDWGPLQHSTGTPVVPDAGQAGAAADPGEPKAALEKSGGTSAAAARPESAATSADPGLGVGQDGGLVERKRPVKPPLDISKWPFTQESVKKVVAYHQDEIQDCYEDAMAKNEKAVEGKILTSFVIISDGHVKNAKVEKRGTNVKEPRLRGCVVAVLNGLVFPKPPDNKRHPVEFPFNLKAIH